MGVTFLFNYSTNNNYSDGVIWAPNRQVLRDLSQDLIEFFNTTQGDPIEQLSAGDTSYTKAYNNSLQTFLKRTGPVIGAEANLYSTYNVSVTNVSHDQTIFCYDSWQWNTTAFYTKCIRVGKGWNANNTESNFSVRNATSSATDASVNVYFSDKATYMNSSVNNDSTTLACLVNGTVPSDVSCDWDKIFSPSNLPSEVRNLTTSVTTQELSSPVAPGALLLEYYTYTAFPVYSLDTSPTSNALNLVQIDDLEYLASGEPVVVNTDWILAAWSVDQNGKLLQNRAAKIMLVQGLNALFGPGISDPQIPALFRLVAYSFYQALSMVNYSNVTAFDPTALISTDLNYPTLLRYATVYVWAYGLSSRTSKLGVAVAIAGGLCVLIRTLLAFATGTQQRSTVELIVAAPEHEPTPEFDGLDDKEREMARVGYHMKEVNGKFQYFAASGATSPYMTHDKKINSPARYME